MKRFVCVLLAALALTVPAEAGVRRVLPEAMFCDALPMPAAEYACLQNGALATHAGPVALPDGGLFARITSVGGFKVAIKSHSTDRVLVYANGAWADDGRISHGTQGHIWTDAGALFVHQPCTDCDSQGIRWWEPGAGPVYGSETYNPWTLTARAKNVTLLYEWTSLDGITIGQGEEGGAVILYQGKHYLLEPGDARFIQFHKAGEQLSVAITKFREREGVLHWLTVAEIPALPPYVPPVVVPVPAPPKPAPVPEPTPEAGPNQLATVQKVRAKYPTPLGEHHWEFLVDVAQQTGCKLFRKDGGDRVFVPPLNRSVSQDILICAPEWVDILGDAETTATPAWGAHPNAGEPEKWIDVSGIDLTGSHSPDPPQPRPDPRIAELEKQLAAAEVRFAIAEAAAAVARTGKEAAERRVSELEVERDDLKAQLAAERGKPAPRCEVRGVPSWARPFGIKASCVVIQ